MEKHKIDKSQWIANMLGALAMQDDGGDQAWDLYRREYENGYWATETNIGAIIKSNVDAARNDGKIRLLPWDAKFWHIGRAEEISHTTTLEGSANSAQAYHLCAARRKRGNILEEMRAEMSKIGPSDWEWMGYTVVRGSKIEDSYKVDSDGYTAVW